MLFIFTSTYREQYIEDMLNILALPEGAIYHFRYEDYHLNQAVHQEWKRQIAKHPDQLLFQDEPALFIFVQQPPTRTTHPDTDLRFFPLRFCTVARLEDQGSVVHLYFRLGPFVDWRTSNLAPATKPRLIDQYDALIKRALVRSEHDGGEALRRSTMKRSQRPPYVFLSHIALPFQQDESVAIIEVQDQTVPALKDSLPVDSESLPMMPQGSAVAQPLSAIPFIPMQLEGKVRENETDRSWVKMVEALGQIPSMQATVYYRIIGVRRSHQGAWWQRWWYYLTHLAVEPLPFYYEPLSLRPILPDRLGYFLNNQQMYFLDINFNYPSQHDEIIRQKTITIKPTIESNLFVNAPAEIPYKLRYDRHSIPLDPKSVSEDILTRMTLQVNSASTPTTQEQQSLPVYAPSIQFYLRLTYSRTQFVFNVLLLVFAQLLTTAGSVILATRDPNFILLGAILAISGPILTSFIIAILFRRLPTLPR
jgi:hypothetical protein